MPARSAARTDVPIPAPPFWGARHLADIDLDAVVPCIDRNSLFKMSWQFRGVHDPQKWAQLLAEELEPRLARSIDEARRGDWLRLQAVYGYWPALADGDSVVIYDPENHDVGDRPLRVPAPARPEPALPRRLRASAWPRRATASATSSPCSWSPPGRARRSSAPSCSAPASTTTCCASTASPPRWPRPPRSGCTRACATSSALEADRGRRYSWGYPSCPDLEDHQTFFRIVPAELIGVELTEGFQLVPEQSTAAIVLHHPEAHYFAVYGGGDGEGPGSPEPAREVVGAAQSR